MIGKTLKTICTILKKSKIYELEELIYPKLVEEKLIKVEKQSTKENYVLELKENGIIEIEEESTKQRKEVHSPKELEEYLGYSEKYKILKK